MKPSKTYINAIQIVVELLWESVEEQVTVYLGFVEEHVDEDDYEIMFNVLVSKFATILTGSQSNVAFTVLGVQTADTFAALDADGHGSGRVSGRMSGRERETGRMSGCGPGTGVGLLFSVKQKSQTQ